ncbi:MAG: hypothetical protein QXW00_03255 [Candidatus Woesearchaeota archaeon]
MRSYRKTFVKVLVVLILTFGVIFFSSLRSYMRGENSFFGLGIPGENIVVMFLCVMAIARAVYVLYRLEDY